MYYVYMAKNSHGRLYTGITESPETRIGNHNRQRGARFTRVGSFRIVFLERYNTLTEARQREVQIKKWRRDKKDILIGRYHRGLPTK